MVVVALLKLTHYSKKEGCASDLCIVVIYKALQLVVQVSIDQVACT